MRTLGVVLRLFALSGVACRGAPPPPAVVPSEPAEQIYKVVATTLGGDEVLLSIEVMSDGAWTAEEGGAKTSGTLSAGDVASLQKTIARTSVKAVEPPGGMCDAVPHVRIVIEARGQSAEFYDHCDVTADPTLDTLHGKVRRLVGLRPR